MRNFSFFVGVFCLISMSVFAQDKAKSIWPSGLIVEVSEDSITVDNTFRKEKEKLELTEKTSYLSDESVTLDKAQSDVYIVVTGTMSDDGQSITPKSGQINFYPDREPSKMNCRVGGWGISAMSVIDGGKLYGQIDDKRIEVMMKPDEKVSIIRHITKEDLAQGMKVRVAGKVQGERRWADKVTVTVEEKQEVAETADTVKEAEEPKPEAASTAESAKPAAKSGDAVEITINKKLH